MITRLRLTNFQSWRTLDVALGRITVVIGETNHGKSALLRGLSCVLFNAMEGAEMVHHGTTTATVEVETDDGHQVQWVRGAKINRFVVDGEVCDKPGRLVPGSVQDALNIGELEFDDEVVRLQWASQRDAEFLLAAGGAKATRMLSVAGKAAVVALAAKIAQDESRTLGMRVAAAQEQLEMAQKAVDSFDYLSRADKLAIDVESLQESVQLNAERRQVVQEAWQVLSGAEDALAQKAAHLREAGSLTDTWALLVQHLECLQTLSVFIAAEQDLCAARAALQTAQQVATLHGGMVKFLEIRDAISGYQHVVALWHAKARDHLVAVAEEQHAHEALTTLLQTYTCPTCGQVQEVVGLGASQ